jgi:hypothetical protein
MTDGTTGQIDYQSTNATQVINAAIGNLTQGHSILFGSGTYILNGSITGINKDNITLAFEDGSTLLMANSMNQPAIFISGCQNWLIQNPTVNGNGDNQAESAPGTHGSNGIELFACNNSRVDGAYIYNVRQFGFYAEASNLVNSVDVGITNSKIMNCSWNGITLGSDGPLFEKHLYAINNEIAYCSDVGITNYGHYNIVQNNYIHDMNGTTGYKGVGIAGSQWGIGVEGGGNHTITGNTVTNVGQGIVISALSTISSFNTISHNNIQYTSDSPIEISSNYNIISQNNISQWDTLGIHTNGIFLDSTANYNTVTDNVLNSTYPGACGIMVYGGNYNQIGLNSVTLVSGGAANGNGVEVRSPSTGTNIYQNTISGASGLAGIVIRSGAMNTVIQSNDLRQVANTVIILDQGTGTIIENNLGY